MRGVKKSRNGCARCKSKRVKCGEEKPHCNRCTRLGVNCPGYVQTLRWVTNQSTGDATDNDNITFEDMQFGSPAAKSPRKSRQSTPPGYTDTENYLNLQQSPLPPNEDKLPDLGNLDDEATALCDDLWDLQQHGTLPELADLCPPSPPAAMSAAGQRDASAMEYGSPASLGSDPWAIFSLAAPVLQMQTRDFPGFDPSTIVRQYPPPSAEPVRPAPRELTSIPQPLNNPSWTLIEYYFKEVAALFSSYDSQMNPFRTTVSRLWGSSLAMCRTMQSMAAATLVNDFPQFGPIGKKMRNEAIDIIRNETSMDDKSLLALLMLGQTASWHDPKDLGISFFNLLRKHIDTVAIAKATNPANRGNNYQFFEESLIYWEMLLSFVADDAAVLPAPSTPSNPAESLVLQRVPHPWTGIARDTQFTVQEAGRLVRAERKRIRSRRFTSQADIAAAQKALEKARELEERLLSIAHPTEAEVVPPGDDETPVWHLLTMAEVYRCTGLLQLYRAFPDLLEGRLPEEQHNSPMQQHQQQQSTTSPNGSAFHPSTPWLNDPPYQPTATSPNQQPQQQASAASNPTPSSNTNTSYHNSWLTEFALTTLSRLKSIPLESRTRCLQPFLLVASSSELRLPPASTTPSSSFDPLSLSESGNGPCISSHALEVSRTRRFILGRLTSLLHVLPPKPISVCLEIVEPIQQEPHIRMQDKMMTENKSDNKDKGKQYAGAAIG
ncbi:fungal-specific transcription factor domain-containing protein [Aspergillus unguis]